MRVRVCYTIEVSDEQRRDIAEHGVEVTADGLATRRGVAMFLEMEGTGGLDAIDGDSERAKGGAA